MKMIQTRERARKSKNREAGKKEELFFYIYTQEKGNFNPKRGSK